MLERSEARSSSERVQLWAGSASHSCRRARERDLTCARSDSWATPTRCLGKEGQLLINSIRTRVFVCLTLRRCVRNGQHVNIGLTYLPHLQTFRALLWSGSSSLCISSYGSPSLHPSKRPQRCRAEDLQIPLGRPVYRVICTLEAAAFASDATIKWTRHLFKSFTSINQKTCSITQLEAKGNAHTFPYLR